MLEAITSHMDNIVSSINNNAFQYACSLEKEVDKICSPLMKYFNIDEFSYTKIFADCSYIKIWSGYKAFQEYSYGNLTDQGQVFCEFIKNLSVGGPFYKIWPRYPGNDSLLLPVYEVGQIWHGIAVFYKTSECVEKFGFSFRRGTGDKTDFFLNNMFSLTEFVNYFRAIAESLICTKDKSKLAIYKKAFDLGLDDSKMRNMDEQRDLDKIKGRYDNFIRTKEGKIIQMSVREYECLKFFSQGKTSKTVAGILKLSPRTVETYLESIKKKTGYHFKSDVIEAFLNCNKLVL